MNTTTQQTGPAKWPIVSLNKFCREAGIDPVTAWRWRRRGWLATVNICGRQYVTGQAVEDFLAPSRGGEFAKKHMTPARWR